MISGLPSRAAATLYSSQQCVDIAVCCSVRPWSVATEERQLKSTLLFLGSNARDFLHLPVNYPSLTAAKKLTPPGVQTLQSASSGLGLSPQL